MSSEKVLEVKDLVISFKTDRGIVHAVRGVSFDLYRGETLCIVGESGSGKSVTNKAIMGISAKNAIIENGSIIFQGEDLIRVSEEEFHRIRGHEIGMIFQDPLSALNPVMRIGQQIIEATMINKNISKHKFNEFIATELVEFRNNEADYSYSVSRLDNEISNNEKFIEKLDEFNKEIEKINTKLARLNEEDKINELQNQLNELEAKKADTISEIKEYIYNVSKITLRELKTLKEDVEILKKRKFDSELKETINANKIAKLNSVIEYLSKPEYVDMSGKERAALVKHNEILENLKKLHKVNFKKCEPALKEDLKISKANAKIKVDEYYKVLEKEHLDKINDLNEKIIKNFNEIENYKLTLKTEEQAEFNEAISFNEKLKKKLKKEEEKFKQTAISATKKNNVEFKVIKNKTLKALVEEKEKLEKLVELENVDFINKTEITKAEAKRMALEVMKEVGIPMPERRFKQYPFEFSGGMRQRIVIAIALTANPKILICDEPTTALDVTIQAQILELINKLKVERNLSCIFITHDLGVVANMADRVAVMYAGKIVEYGTANEVFFDPRHPYTWALLSSIPDVDSKEKLDAIPGTPPDMIYPPKGDAFALRSKYALAIDFKYEPPYFKISDTHYAATWLLHKDAPKVEMPAIVRERIKNALKNKGGK